MVEFDHWRTAITRSIVGAVVLALALVVHAGAALVKVAQRRTFRLPGWEWLQLALGLAIPLLLLPHVVNTRVSNLAFGIDTSYPYELRKIWTDTMLDQSLLLLLVWVHGCLGLHYWLRLARGYRALSPYLLVAAALLPFAALLGVVTQGREMAALTADPAAFAALKASTHWPDAATEATIIRWRADARIGFYAIAAARGPVRRRPHAAAAPRDAHSGAVRVGAAREGGRRADAARGQPHVPHSAHVGVRRPRPVLDLPGHGLRRGGGARAGERGRAADAAFGRRRGQRAPGLPGTRARLRDDHAAGAPRAPAPTFRSSSMTTTKPAASSASSPCCSSTCAASPR